MSAHRYLIKCSFSWCIPASRRCNVLGNKHKPEVGSTKGKEKQERAEVYLAPEQRLGDSRGWNTSQRRIRVVFWPHRSSRSLPGPVSSLSVPGRNRVYVGFPLRGLEKWLKQTPVTCTPMSPCWSSASFSSYALSFLYLFSSPPAPHSHRAQEHHNAWSEHHGLVHSVKKLRIRRNVLSFRIDI